MVEARAKNLRSPDETLEFPGIKVQQVDLGDLTVGRIVTDPGWRWSTHVRPHVGGDWCEARHVGVVLSGRFEIVMRDGTTLQFGPEDVFEIPPGHDGYTLGDEPCVQIEWSGLRAFAGFRLAGTHNRALATLLFTDLVDSTVTANRLGDVALARSALDALRSNAEGARAAPGTRGQHDRRRPARYIRRTGSRPPGRRGDPLGGRERGSPDSCQRPRRRGGARGDGRARRRGARSGADTQ